ncbi:MAG: ribosome silencing factor [Gammaproteobacteria bacterium]|nr:ribosome silencing factor [Gammaproteobacteria bacterium]
MRDAIVSALDEAKGKDIQAFDVRDMTDVTDYMIVASGTSDRHVKALAGQLIDTMRENGHRPIGVEGEDTADWILIDFGDVVAHVMREQTREFYDLEGLWSEQVRDLVKAQREGRLE